MLQRVSCNSLAAAVKGFVEMAGAEINQWHLDKRIPIALIVTILSGYAGGIIWITNLSNKVGSHDKEIQRIDLEVDRRQEANTDATNRIIRIEEKLANQSDLLKDIREAVMSRPPAKN